MYLGVMNIYYLVSCKKPVKNKFLVTWYYSGWNFEHYTIKIR